jgi:hypothetical protein
MASEISTKNGLAVVKIEMPISFVGPLPGAFACTLPGAFFSDASLLGSGLLAEGVHPPAKPKQTSKQIRE